MTATDVQRGTLEDALALVAAGAARRDRAPTFPSDALAALIGAGATVPPKAISAEWALVRRVAAADGSVGRIFDGHLNAVERIRVAAPDPLRAELERAVTEDGALLGVWGADPAPGEGDPARLDGSGERRRLHGAKTFCSGAGGLDGALVVAGADDGRLLVHVDLHQPGVEIDRTWFRAMGMRSSESHLVRFKDVETTVLGGPGELGREPYFGRDALRTTHTWAGLAVAVAAAGRAALASRARDGDDLAALALGRIATQLGTIDRWLHDAAARADADPTASLRTLSVHARDAVAAAARTLVDEAERGVGARPLATGSDLDRAARDLRVFLLQHRLDPLVARAGREAAG
jgi:hypothetical protein